MVSAGTAMIFISISTFFSSAGYPKKATRKTRAPKNREQKARVRLGSCFPNQEVRKAGSQARGDVPETSRNHVFAPWAGRTAKRIQKRTFWPNMRPTRCATFSSFRTRWTLSFGQSATFFLPPRKSPREDRASWDPLFPPTPPFRPSPTPSLSPSTFRVVECPLTVYATG